jgi:4-amino-4-deoxy-L-arabinose transferase-like glycosyltransferase
MVLILLAGLALRLTNLDASSLWMDETYSLMVANGHLPPDVLHPTVQAGGQYYQNHLAWQPLDFHRLLEALKINVHMPLYYLLLNPWLGWLGNTALGLRSFSALCATLLLLPLYSLGRALGGRHVGLTAMAVAALAPFQIYYGQEGRMYALSMLWCALSGWAFWKTLYSSKPLGWSLLYALSVISGLGTHYMVVFYLIFQAVYALLWLVKTRDFKRFCLFGFAVAALGALLAAWFPIYQIQQQGVNEEYHFAKGSVGWLRYVTALVWQPLVMVAGDNKLERLFYMPLTVLLSFSMLWKRHQSPEDKQDFFRQEGFLLMWIFIPILAQIGYDVLKHTHTVVIDRYVLLISPAMCLWLGLAIARLQKIVGNRTFQKLQTSLLGIMLLLAICTVWSPSPFRDEHNKDNDIRGQFRYMTTQVRPDDLVFTNGPWGASLLAAYYLHQQRPNQPMIYWINVHNAHPVPLPQTALLKPYHRVWLFRNRANNERGLQQAKEYLQALYPAHTRQHDWFIYWDPAASPTPRP